MYKAGKKLCFGVIIGTRAYFNPDLAIDVRKELLRVLDECDYDYVILPEDATPTGSSSIETREDGLKVAAQFKQHREEIDGIIVALPNFGFEIGIINAINEANLGVPVLVRLMMTTTTRWISTTAATPSAARSPSATTCISTVSRSPIPPCIPTTSTIRSLRPTSSSSPVSAVS